MIRIITDQQNAQVFCDFLNQRIPGSALSPTDTRTIGYVEFNEQPDGTVTANILAAAGFHHWSDKAVEVAIASNGEKKQKTSHEFIWTCYSYIFDVCKKTAMFATVGVDNEKSMAVAEMLGMTKKGLIPDYLGENKDAYLYSITRNEWQKGRFATKDKLEINTPIVMTKEQNKGVLH
jgi:RimJ/RimL family protein N-acetyltransferase